MNKELNQSLKTDGKLKLFDENNNKLKKKQYDEVLNLLVKYLGGHEVDNDYNNYNHVMNVIKDYIDITSNTEYHCKSEDNAYVNISYEGLSKFLIETNYTAKIKIIENDNAKIIYNGLNELEATHVIGLFEEKDGRAYLSDILPNRKFPFSFYCFRTNEKQKSKFKVTILYA